MQQQVDEKIYKEALKWASKKIDINSSNVIRKNPWGITSRLEASGGTYYLKALPAELTPSISITHEISRVIPEFTPKVISRNSTRGWLLLEDHKAHHSPSELGYDDFAALDAYAALQSIASRQITKFGSLGTFNWEKTWQQVIEFLSIGKSSSDGKARLSDFLGTEDTILYPVTPKKRPTTI